MNASSASSDYHVLSKAAQVMDSYPVNPTRAVGIASMLFVLAFCRLSPSSKSTKAWTAFYLTVFFLYTLQPLAFQATTASIKLYASQHPIKTTLTLVAIAAPLKYLQQKLRYARLNAIKMKFGYTNDPATWQDMTVEQAQEIESNMAEVRPCLTGDGISFSDLSSSSSGSSPDSGNSAGFLTSSG